MRRAHPAARRSQTPSYDADASVLVAIILVWALVEAFAAEPLPQTGPRLDECFFAVRGMVEAQSPLCQSSYKTERVIAEVPPASAASDPMPQCCAAIRSADGQALL